MDAPVAHEPHPRSRSRRGVVPAALVLLAALLAGPLSSVVRAEAQPAPASSGPGEINLAPHIVYNVSQVDWRWSALETIGDKRIGACGCMLSVLSTMIGLHLNVRPGANGNSAWSPIPQLMSELITWEWITGPEDSWYRKRIVLDTVTGPFFSPAYVHKYLRQGPPGWNKADMWGYVNKGGGQACGPAVQPHAMENAAIPSVAVLANPDGTTNDVQVGPTGIAYDYHYELRTDLIDANLLQGKPTVVGREYPKDDGTLGYHVSIIVGWDAKKGQYRIVDPVDVTGASGRTVFVDEPQKYQEWLGQIVATMDMYPVHTPSAHFAMVDDPSPIEMNTVLPDGRLVGYDPVTGKHNSWRGHFDYRFPAETPPDGSYARPTDPVKGLQTTNPEPGVHRATIVGTGTGTYQVALKDIDADGAEHVLADLAGSVTAGQRVKNEVTYAEDGTATAVPVTNYTPEPVVEPVSAVAGEAVTLDASRSFDADGRVAGIDWEFGDGATATGDRPSHTWAKPGAYPMEVTATDDQGATRTETVVVNVDPSETAAPSLALSADPNGAVDGWTDAEQVRVTATGTDAGSGVESITLSAEGADPQPTTVVTGSAAEMVLDAEGATTVKAVATDRMGNVSGSEVRPVGIDRTPATATVRSPGPDQPVSALGMVTGSATDAASGVEAVHLRVQRADGASFNGTAWVNEEAWLPATGTDGGWYVAGGLPAGDDLPDGIYTLTARATDRAGSTGPASAPTTVTVAAATTGLPVQDLPPPAGRPGSEGLAVTDDGQAVGVASPLGLADTAAVRWVDGVLVALPNPAGRAGARADGVDSDGGTVVGWALNGSGQPRATAWVDGVATDLGVLPGGGSLSVAHDINDAGMAVGSAAVEFGMSRSRAVRFSGGQAHLVADLGGEFSEAMAVNEAGDIVGFGERPGGSAHQAFVTRAGESAEALGDPSSISYAYDINDAGQVAGSDGEHAVVWENGTSRVLGPGSALALAADGTAVGVTYRDDGPAATLWHNGDQIDLNGLIDAGRGWRLEKAEAISDDGRVVVGSGILAGQPRGFLLDLGAWGGGGGSGGDSTAPTTTATVTPAEAASGWARGPVDVALAAADETGGSGVASITHSAGDPITAADGTVRIEREGTTALAFAATDVAGNVEVPPGTATVRIDATAPTASVTAPAPPAAPASGWHRVPVAVAVSGHDGGSGLAQLSWQIDGGAPVTGPPGDVEVGTDGEHVVSVLATDEAGNTGAAARATVRVDATAPAVIFSGLDDGATVKQGMPLLVAATDAHSGVAGFDVSVSTGSGGPQPTMPGALLTSAGPTTIEVRATDVAGNDTIVVRHVVVEPTEPAPSPSTNQPPVADAGGPYVAAAGALLTLDGRGSTDPDGDALSYTWYLDGTELATGPTTSLKLDPGVYMLHLVVDDGEAPSATWHGSEAITTITVTEGQTWPWSGFKRPVDNPPAVNVVRAGSTVPLKFKLGGDRGLDIFPADAPPASAPVLCGGGTAGGSTPLAAPGTTGLTYDSGAHQYHLNWKTDESWAGTCRRLVLRLADGSERTAEFRFR